MSIERLCYVPLDSLGQREEGTAALKVVGVTFPGNSLRPHFRLQYPETGEYILQPVMPTSADPVTCYALVPVDVAALLPRAFDLSADNVIRCS